MATCAYCNTEETELYESNVPICLKCSEARTVKPTSSASEREIHTTLLQDLLQATALNDEANREFYQASKIPNELPQSDGVQRIHNASHKLDAARREMMKAHTRLNDYLERGIVPDDLKPSGTP